MKSLVIITLLSLFFTANSQDIGSFVDERDGHEYKTVTIGEQIWMAENLAYLPDTVYRYSKKLDMPEYYVYGWSLLAVGGFISLQESGPASELKENRYYKELGALYNWKAANITCPSGWHLPSKEEWEVLVNYLGGDKIAGYKMKDSEEGWGKARGSSASNESGFSVRGGGYCAQDGTSSVVYQYANFWTSTPSSSKEKKAWRCYLSDRNKKVNFFEYRKTDGASIRCVKD